MTHAVSKLGAVLLAGLMTIPLSACATSFTGSPHVEGGRNGCAAKCHAQGMEIAGMVYMGEYSDACVCSVPGQSAMRRRLLMAAAATAGGASGVVMQMRRQAQQQSEY